MPRRIRVNQPSSTGNIALDRTLQEFTEQLNILPAMSIISTSGGPESAFSGDSGDIAIDIGSSATTFWGKITGSNSTVGWREFNLRGSTAFSSLRIAQDTVLSNVGAATQMPFGVAGDERGITASTSNNEFLVPAAGDYKVDFSVSGYENVGAAITAVKFDIRINDSDTGIFTETNLPSGASLQPLGTLSSVISVSSNDSVQIFITTTNATDDIIFSSAHFTLHQIL